MSEREWVLDRQQVSTLAELVRQVRRVEDQLATLVNAVNRLTLAASTARPQEPTHRPYDEPLTCPVWELGEDGRATLCSICGGTGVAPPEQLPSGPPDPAQVRAVREAMREAISADTQTAHAG